MIVTGSTDQTVRTWNPKTGECTHVFRGYDIALNHAWIGDAWILTGSLWVRCSHGFFEGPVCFVECHPSVSTIYETESSMS
jgi:hypothetical protein